MTKARGTITYEFEYDLDGFNYSDISTAQEVADETGLDVNSVEVKMEADRRDLLHGIINMGDLDADERATDVSIKLVDEVGA